MYKQKLIIKKLAGPNIGPDASYRKLIHCK